MSCPAFLPSFVAEPAMSSLGGPAPLVDAPVANAWQAWTTRLDAVLAANCRELQQRGRRARRITITLRFASGRTRRRTLTLVRPGDRLSDFQPAAYGMLRLLVDGHPAGTSRIQVTLGRLVEGSQQPIRLDRIIAERRQQSSVARRMLARLFREASR